jgi:hypothetical protein
VVGDFFRISRESRFPRQASRIWKSSLVDDLEDFDFLHCEKGRNRENSLPAQAGVVRVRGAKVIPTVGVFVAVIANPNVTANAWTSRRSTPDCFVLLFGLQRKFALR